MLLIGTKSLARAYCATAVIGLGAHSAPVMICPLPALWWKRIPQNVLVSPSPSAFKLIHPTAAIEEFFTSTTAATTSTTSAPSLSTELITTSFIFRTPSFTSLSRSSRHHLFLFPCVLFYSSNHDCLQTVQSCKFKPPSTSPYASV